MYKIAIITSSDKASKGERDDLSGPLIKKIMTQNGYEIVAYSILPDEREMLSNAMKKICDSGTADLILTTGGTGLSPRDWTPEATLDIAHRQVPGIAEAIRAYSLSITNRAMLSRAVAVVREQTLIINLPGSPKAAQEGLEYIIPTLPHALSVLCNTVSDCAR